MRLSGKTSNLGVRLLLPILVIAGIMAIVITANIYTYGATTTDYEVSKTLPMAFDTVYVEDPNMDKGEERVVAKGVKGEIEIIQKVREYEGREISREEISRTVIEPPQDRIIARGTREYYFSWPYDGILTSYFGYRDDAPGTTDHQGIDINASYGTPVVAARAGKVMEDTGWAEGYGNLVCIDHGDGMVSMYAHNSEIAVCVGDEVQEGDVIAYAGSTGWSSGTHVHFEVHKDGEAVDPLDYLPER